MIETAMVFGIASGMYAIVAGIVLLVLGGMMGTEIGGLVGLAWRCAVIGALGAVGTVFVPFPFNIDAYLLMAFGLMALTSGDHDDYIEIAAFLAAMFVTNLLVLVTLGILFDEFG